jgi:hypothetical protein
MFSIRVIPIQVSGRDRVAMWAILDHRGRIVSSWRRR